MIRAACRVLVCCLLLSLCGPPQSGSAGAREDAKKFVILTDERPVGYFEIPWQVLASKPPILFLSITQVVNPQRTPYEVLVYFARVHSRGAKEEKVRLGGFALYPSDKPAGFQLSTSRAFSELEATSGAVPPEALKLELELRRIHETQPWGTVQLTVAEPEWRSGKSE